MNEKEIQEKSDFLSKLPYNISNKKVKELQLEDWGTLEEVEKMAEMPIDKQDQKRTKIILEELRKNGELKNNFNEKLIATLSADSIKKLLNGNWIVAANIKKLFENAIEPWIFEFDSNKDNRDLKERKYLYSPMNYKGKIVPVKITVFIFKKPENEVRLYSGEIINYELKKSGRWSQMQGLQTTAPPLPARRPITLKFITISFKCQ